MRKVWPSVFSYIQGTQVRIERTQKVVRTAALSYTAFLIKQCMTHTLGAIEL
jgi:hypothetical protein